jgi:hypothetical protein
MKKKLMISELDKEETKNMYMTEKQESKPEINNRDELEDVMIGKSLSTSKFRKLSEQCSLLHSKMFYSENLKSFISLIK